MEATTFNSIEQKVHSIFDKVRLKVSGTKLKYTENVIFHIAAVILTEIRK